MFGDEAHVAGGRLQLGKQLDELALEGSLADVRCAALPLAVVIGVVTAGATLRPAPREGAVARLTAYEPTQREVGMIARPRPGDDDTPLENRLHLIEGCLTDQRFEVAATWHVPAHLDPAGVYGIVQHGQLPDAATLGSTEEGLAIEVGFGTSTSLTELKADEPHRRAGAGIRIRTRLPLSLTEDEAAAYANAFNLAEARGASETTHYGAWCWDSWRPGDVTLAYQVFIPNVLYRVGVAQDIALSMLKRARWVDWGINGRQSLTDPRQAVLERFAEFLEAKRDLHV